MNKVKVLQSRIRVLESEIKKTIDTLILLDEYLTKKKIEENVSIIYLVEKLTLVLFSRFDFNFGIDENDIDQL